MLNMMDMLRDLYNVILKMDTTKNHNITGDWFLRNYRIDTIGLKPLVSGRELLQHFHVVNIEMNDTEAFYSEALTDVVFNSKQNLIHIL